MFSNPHYIVETDYSIVMPYSLLAPLLVFQSLAHWQLFEFKRDLSGSNGVLCCISAFLHILELIDYVLEVLLHTEIKCIHSSLNQST